MMRKLLYLNLAAIACLHMSTPSFAMDEERCGRSVAPKKSRFASKNKSNRFDPPKQVDNATLLKIYGADLVKTNKSDDAHKLDQKLTRREFSIGDVGAYVEIETSKNKILAAHKEPDSTVLNRKLSAIQFAPTVIAILEEVETRVIPTMGVSTHESVGGIYILRDTFTGADVLTDLEGWDYSGPKPIAVTKQVPTYITLFSQESFRRSNKLFSGEIFYAPVYTLGHFSYLQSVYVNKL